jgi:hypothetical protein
MTAITADQGAEHDQPRRRKTSTTPPKLRRRTDGPAHAPDALREVLAEHGVQVQQAAASGLCEVADKTYCPEINSADI